MLPDGRFGVSVLRFFDMNPCSFSWQRGIIDAAPMISLEGALSSRPHGAVFAALGQMES
jgi:hypothetical protein